MQIWNDVDAYFGATLIPDDPTLENALRASREAGLPAIQVAANQGKLLQLLARAIGARRILEVGTLGGYSTIWLARALGPDGRLTTLELDPRHAEVATSNIAAAGLGEIVDVRVGKAVESLATLHTEGAGPYDLIFIDADKPSNLDYFEWALRLSRRGSIIIVDNVVRNGAVADAESTDPNVIGVRRLHDALAEESRVDATSVQTVGSKGYDGFTLAVVTDPVS